MLQTRTSTSHPIEIAQVQAGENSGQIGITFCPGKQDLFAATGSWQRDLEIDLNKISEWKPALILTLLEPLELKSLKVPNLGEAVQSRGITWRHLPIADYSTPDQHFEQQWLSVGAEIRELLLSGKNILVHCKGGLGRAGMIAARLLVELGVPPQRAINQVRLVRKGAIETPSQLAIVKNSHCLVRGIND